MYDLIDVTYRCGLYEGCRFCEYEHICDLYTKHYYHLWEIDEFYTIHYAEGEI